MDLSGLLVLLGMIFMGLAAFGVALPRVHFGWLGATLVVLGALVLGSVHL